ncbi:MAG: oxidoreductase [Terriglobales bacterium]
MLPRTGTVRAIQPDVDNSLAAAAAPSTAYPHEVLFQPMALRHLTLKNRLVMAPMGTCLDVGGQITDATIAYYRRRAEGGVGTITVEGCLVSADTVGPEPGIHSRAYLGGLTRLVDALRPYDITIGVQLMHPGRQVVDGPRVAPSPVPLNSAAPVPHELTVDEIRRIVEDYGRSAVLAEEAGFDFVEVHGAHGYLPSNFLSPRSNQRTDDYGGDARRRARFCLEVVASIREACADRLPVLWRINGTDGVPGGLELEDSVRVSQWLEQAGIAALSVSGGTWHNLEVTIAPMSAPRGQLVPMAAAVKRAVNVPVMAVGRLDDPEFDARVILNGQADLVILGRALIAEPDWPNKVRAGDDAGRRPCIACNACVDLVARGQRARCAVNPEVGRELEWRVERAPEARNIMVVGSGPAGMEAARIARLRGHHVSIWERDVKLGGKLEVAGLAPSKHEVLRFRDYQAQLLRRLGVRMHLGVEVTAELVEAEHADLVLLATGADPLIPPIPGIDAANVVDGQAILRGEVPVAAGARAVVVGGSATGCETAEFLLGAEAEVTMLEMRSSVGQGIEAITRRNLIRTLRSQGVRILTRAKLTMVQDGHVVYENADGADHKLAADVVALAMGWRPRGQDLAAQLNGVEVIVLGDAGEPADFLHAINAGADAGLAA